MPAKVEEGKSTKIIKTAKRNRTTGRFAGYSEVEVATDTHLISIDKVPFLDKDGNPVQLLKKPPTKQEIAAHKDKKISAEMEKKMDENPIPGIVLSQPKRDRED